EKWLLGPVQLAYLYVAPHRQDGEPIEYNWINRRDSEDYNRLVDYRDAYQPGARRFDVGERGNFVTVPMGIEALRQINEWTVPAIEETLRALVDRIVEGGHSLGLKATPAGLRAPHMVGLRGRGIGGDLADRLAAEN